MSGAILARYRILEPIGAGGQGAVFLAQRHGSPELCVLKRLTPEMEQRESAVSRFQREAQIAAMLDHPGIARTIDAGFDGGSFYLAMELIPGRDLESIRLHFEKLGELPPIDFALTVVTRALEALAYAHTAAGAEGEPLCIVHRDLAPKNVMITFDGQVKLIDFGIARANVGSFRTAAQMLVGTPKYFSPEQALARPIDGRSDLYTLSAVLFELLSGRPLATGSSIADLVRAVILQEAPPLRPLRPELPEALELVLQRGLAKKPDERFANATEYLDALRRAAPGRELDQRALSTLMRGWFPEEERRIRERMVEARRSGDTEAPEQFLKTTTQLAEPPLRELRRPRRLGLLVPLVLLAAAALLLVLLSAQPRPVASPPSEPALLAEAVPSIVPRPEPPTETPEPVLAPRRLEPARPPKSAPPSIDLEQMLARRRLTKSDLEHQHALDRPLQELEAALRSKDAERIRTAARRLEQGLDRIDHDPKRLQSRLSAVRARLEQLEPTMPEAPFRDLERRYLDAMAQASPNLTPPGYRELCAMVDDLERRLEQ